MFEDGERIARGCSIVAIALFVIVAVGIRYGTTPAKGGSLGRVQAMRHFRWIALAGAVVGLLMMALASL